ncbi:Transposase [Cordylochernes scorpioides]|uniref:Transposase n=1 Tax=Cordylochernes scorpioides TaxID=51811 RepID=A0ABY6K860_9ARAC|nr:Transposase [Cordylochernes scorpioides]
MGFRQIDIDENWLSNVLWTDDAHFSLNGEFNIQNSRIWATENPRIFTEMPLYQPRVTVLCGFTSFIIGSFFFEKSMEELLKPFLNVGATRVTSARVDRRILRQAVAAPQATCTAILQHVQDTLDHSISTRTISRRLVANGLHSCRPLRRLPLTPPNRRQRLEWCRARSTWMTEWLRVVFSDESRFCLSSDSRRVRVWRRRGERSNPAAIVERPTVRQRGIMVWGAIAYDSRSPLLRIQGTMTAQRYVDDVLRPVTLPYLQGVPNALYQQDNTRPHTARISQQALQDVQMLPWPPFSPDLSPIEHVWDIIGRRLHALPQPRSEDELWQMVEREWRAIPQDAIRTLIDSLPRRVAACIAVRGGPTCY